MERNAEIEQVTRRILAACARGDVQAVIDTFDQDIVMIGTDPDEYWTGAETAGSILRAQLETIRSFDIGGEVVGRASDDMGWSVVVGPCRIGTGLLIEGARLSMVFRLVRGTWRLQHWHASVGAANAETLGVELPTSIDEVMASVLAEGPAAVEVDTERVTIVFTDIESSTELAADLGDEAWFSLLRSHDDLLRGCARRHGGRVVKMIGDGAMLAFSDGSDAIRFARELQAALRDHQGLRGIRVRVGAHSGSAIHHNEDLFGTAVNLAARIAGAARGGETLVSADLHADVPTSAGFRFGDAIEIELKGIPGRTRIQAVF